MCMLVIMHVLPFFFISCSQMCCLRLSKEYSASKARGWHHIYVIYIESGVYILFHKFTIYGFASDHSTYTTWSTWSCILHNLCTFSFVLGRDILSGWYVSVSILRLSLLLLILTCEFFRHVLYLRMGWGHASIQLMQLCIPYRYVPNSQWMLWGSGGLSYMSLRRKLQLSLLVHYGYLSSWQKYFQSFCLSVLCMLILY